MVMKPKTSAAKQAVKSTANTRTTSGKNVAKAIDACVGRGSPKLQQVAGELRRLVKKTLPESRETINPWGIPAFDLQGPVCFMMVGKNHVTLGFSRGTSLTDPGGLLEGTGKNMRHVKLREPEQMRDANLRRLILEAAALNRDAPLTPSMRVKKPN